MSKKSQPISMHKLIAAVGISLIPCLLAGHHCLAGDENNESKNPYKKAMFNKLPVTQPVHAPSTTASSSAVIVTVDASQRKEIDLQITAVKRGLVHKTVECPGRVGPDAEQTRAVSTPSAGRAVEVKARLGDNVKSGQIMAIMKSDPIGQVQSDLLQNVLQAKADIATQEVQMKLSRITFERESTLYKEQVSAKADLQAAENQLEKDESNLSALKQKLAALMIVAQERLTLLGAPPDSATKVIEQRKIDPFVIVRAPASGLVIDRQINPGELNDGSKPLFTITNLSEVWLFGDIFERDIESVRKGQEAFVKVDSLPDHKFPANIIWVGDSISPTTRTLPVRANVINPDFLLKPGMFARMKIMVGDVPVMLVPATAVIQKGDASLVFVDAGNNNFVEKEVKPGIADKDNVEILSGLKEGERVVSRGGTALLGASMKSLEGR